MKNILFVWFFLNGCSQHPVTLKDTSGKQHIYSNVIVNKNNWCELHEKWELVERRISYKN
tara:strand:+ start:199 stop:378 length:180 start_codon:yes stop_codon:yes gene_type:complete